VSSTFKLCSASEHFSALLPSWWKMLLSLTWLATIFYLIHSTTGRALLGELKSDPDTCFLGTSNDLFAALRKVLAMFGLKLVILLHQPPECWDYSPGTPCLAFSNDLTMSKSHRLQGKQLKTCLSVSLACCTFLYSTYLQPYILPIVFSLET
jgi:hypothetical protein